MSLPSYNFWNCWTEKNTFFDVRKPFWISKYRMSSRYLYMLLISKTQTACVSFAPNKQDVSFRNDDWFSWIFFNVFTFDLLKWNLKRTISISLSSQRHWGYWCCVDMSYEWIQEIINHLRFFCVCNIIIMSTTLSISLWIHESSWCQKHSVRIATWNLWNESSVKTAIFWEFDNISHLKVIFYCWHFSQI